MIQKQRSSYPAESGLSFFSGLLNKDLAPEFVPGRTRHLGMMDTSLSTASFMPSQADSLVSQTEPDWESQSEDIGNSTSPSITSCRTHPSVATSRSAFDDYIEFCNTHRQPTSNDLPFGVPTGPAADRIRQHQSSQLQSYPRVENQPPLNAPTGPAAQRRQSTRTSPGTSQQQLIRPAKPASWSQSLTWTSMDTKWHAQYNKVVARLRYMGAHNSPAAPQSLNEYLGYKLHALRRDLARRRRNMKPKEAPSTRQGQHEAEGEGDDPVQRIKLGGMLYSRLTSGNLSPFFGADLCWNAYYTDTSDVPYEERVEWPPLAAFKEAGRRVELRAPDRSLPLPRQNETREHLHAIEGDGACEESGQPSYYERSIKMDRLGLFPLHLLEEEGDKDAVCDVDPKDLTAWTRDIIHHIGLDEEEEIELTDDEEKQQKKK